MRQIHTEIAPALSELGRAYDALDAVSMASPALASQVDHAIAQLHDLAWIARSRAFDGELRSLVHREVARAALAADILAARCERAGSYGLDDAIAIFETHVRRGVSALRQARVSATDNALPPARMSLRALRTASDSEPADRDQPEMDRAAA